MTDLIYLTDGYQKELKTKIVSLMHKGTIWEIVLEKTIFYPEGGGQPADKGQIIGKNSVAHVKHVRLSNNVIVHECSLEGNLHEGENVNCEIDWAYRYHNMRVHSAGHIVHEATMTVLPYLTPLKGQHHEPAFIEYKGSLTPEKKYLIEQKANEIVQKNLPLITEFVTLDELVQRSSFVPAHLPRNKPLRILEIQGYKPIPDGGTQVQATGEVGEITITKLENNDETVRVYYDIEDKKRKEGEQGSTLSTASFIGLLMEAEQSAKEVISNDSLSIEERRRLVLGPSGELAKLTKLIRNVPIADRHQAGTVLNEVKQRLEELIRGKAVLHLTSYISGEFIDVTMPGHMPIQGHLHPTTIVIREMNAIFAHMSFSVADGPEIETDEYNYNRVNLPMDHPARDLQDTLYIEEPNILLRTHTSSVEARLLETFKPPYRFVIPGKVFRSEKANATNNIMFYQYQGLAVGRDISMANLKGTLDTFVRKFFGEKRETRFRCKYYPEVEPGAGVDIDCVFCNKRGCAVCKGRGWIEILGAGMIHPNMLRRVDLDPKEYSGFAWGMGLDRIVMQRYGISDIRSLYNGDIGFRE